jgi:hypothetical protein
MGRVDGIREIGCDLRGGLRSSWQRKREVRIRVLPCIPLTGRSLS